MSLMLRRLLLLTALVFSAAVAQTPPPAPPPEARHEIQRYTLPPDKLKKAIEYSDAKDRLHFVSVGYGLLVLAAVLAWKAAPRYRDLAERASRHRIAQAFIFGPLLVVTVDVLSLPVSLYEQRLELKFEQSVQGWGSWVGDWLKGEVIGCILTGFFIWILYAAIRRSPRRWWFYGWLATIPMVVFLLFVRPVLIEPLFFKYEPLADKEPALVAEIQKVVARSGLAIPSNRMFEMNASSKLNSLNADVEGLGSSKRVVVWDTTIRKMTVPQILFVFGHEMGHYVLGHTYILIGAACVVILVFMFLGYHAMRWALDRWGAVWGIRGVDDWASLPVLMVALAIFSFFSEPVLNSVSRQMEHAADIYGLEVIHGLAPNPQQTAAEAFQILGEVSLSDPNPSPFIEFWLYNHPSVQDRVQFAAQYDPWAQGKGPKYVK
jgi:Zn-dependent protease with chaperone function